MTEQELMDLDFQKVMVLNEESDNGYDYYYFRKEIIKGFTLTADYNTNNNLVVFSIEPNFVIKDIQTLKELINVFSKIKNARREVSLSKENG
jgi:hypothetical protein|tara:strand:- start:2376 stop:2651 length:276 start_codon:yes stop_codon:yes gene_type:complete